MGELAEELHHEAELAELRKANLRLSRALDKSRAKTAEMVEAVYRAAHDAAILQGVPKAVARPKADRRHSPETALLHLTDWQYGKITGSYSMEKCAARIDKAVSLTDTLTDVQRADHPVRDCHLMLGGDMVEGRGNIFPGQVYEIESYLFEQLFGVAKIIADAVLRLLGMFEHVTVWEESGNHGRLGRKGEDAPGDNVDLMAYRIARQQLGDQPRLVWNRQTSWHQIVTIGEYRAMLAHGDEIKSFGGNVPAFGILRKCNAWASGVVEPFTDVYLGHYHQAMTLQLANGGRVFVTPSPESDSIYAQEFVAATGMPGQRLHFVSPKRGRVTSEHLLWLDQ